MNNKTKQRNRAQRPDDPRLLFLPKQVLLIWEQTRSLLAALRDLWTDQPNKLCKHRATTCFAF